MKDFLESSTSINSSIKHLNSYTEELSRYMMIKQNSVLNEREETALDGKIESVNSLFTELSCKIKAMVRKNQNETLEMRKSGARKGLIEMRELHTFRQGKDLAEALRNYQNVQCDYKEREKEKLRETLLIANPRASEHELEMLTDMEEGEALLASAFALGSHSAQSIMVQARHRKRKIEKIIEMINTLVQLIEDIDKLVKKSGEDTDRIVVNMVLSEEHTTMTKRELTSALISTKRRMWFKRFFFFILIIIIALIGISNRRRFKGLFSWDNDEDKKKVK